MAKAKITPKPVSATSDPADQLYRAVAAYVKSRGGSVVVAGGIEVQQWPADPAFSFRIAVRCTGTEPQYAQRQTPRIKPLYKRKRKAGA